MKKPVFRGAATALVTPMHPNGILDLETLKKLVLRQVESGIDALVPCGTTGECAVLSAPERLAVIETVVSAAEGRVPVIAGAGSNDTVKMLDFCRDAEKAGADALLLVTPYYNKCTENGLITHFLRAADAVSIPIILYHVPSRTGVRMGLHAREVLSRHPNIAGIKEAAPDLTLVSETADACGDALPVYSGNDDLTLPVMSLGGIGVISVTSNLFPREMHWLTSLMLDGKPKEALQLHRTLFPLMRELFCEVNPVPVKRAMEWIGLAAGPCRLPLGHLDDIHAKKLRSLVETLKNSSEP